MFSNASPIPQTFAQVPPAHSNAYILSRISTTNVWLGVSGDGIWRRIAPGRADLFHHYGSLGSSDKQLLPLNILVGYAVPDKIVIASPHVHRSPPIDTKRKRKRKVSIIFRSLVNIRRSYVLIPRNILTSTQLKRHNSLRPPRRPENNTAATSHSKLVVITT